MVTPRLFDMKSLNNEKGFVLITSLLILVVVMIIGIAATNTSILELQISGNDRLTKETFYAAEGGIEVGISLIELSLDRKGLPQGDFTLVVDDDPRDIYQFRNLYILSNNYTMPHLFPNEGPDDNSEPHFFYSYGGVNNGPDTIPRVDVWLAGETRLLDGSSILMLRAAEGTGASIGGGGVRRLYEVFSTSYGPNNSLAELMAEWQHIQ